MNCKLDRFTDDYIHILRLDKSGLVHHISMILITQRNISNMDDHVNSSDD